MRVADYIFKTLADWGIEHVFLVTGGGAMYLNDGLRREKRLRYVCCHHEQACAIAAEGCFRASGKMAAVNVTSGPGGTNALTGVAGQWLDSVPVLYLSGQVKFQTTIGSCPEIGLRQLGDQELNITDVVRPITKYCAFVASPESIRKELERARHCATTGRPGPVWLDIPLDVQGAVIDENSLEGFSPPPPVDAELGTACAKVIELLRQAKRPVVVAGWGIRLAGAQAGLLDFLHQSQIPVLSTFNAMDLAPSDEPLFAGRIGTLGQRRGNFVLQNADLILSVGSRNNVRQVSYNWEGFGRNAVKISVDIDRAELKKRTFVPDLAICADAGEFLNTLAGQCRTRPLPSWTKWRTWVDECKARNPEYTAEHLNWSDRINPYYFMRVLTEKMTPEMDLVAGNGTACVALFQTGLVKAGQRIFWNSGCASMGYDLPAAAGAAVGSGRTTVCLAGDGSIMMNLQELQTVIRYRLPVKVFLLDNNGYGSIKQTQTGFFGSELIGCDDTSGVSFPDFLKLAEAFGFQVFEAKDQTSLPAVIERTLESGGPAFCVVRMPDSFSFAPKLSSRKLPDGTMVSSPLEDMAPFMPRDEFNANMISPTGEW